MMPSTSRSNRRKSKKPVRVVKQEWRVKQPSRNWLELPSDITANILSRIGVFDILENAQKVCTTWHKICKDPAMWRVIEMRNLIDPNARPGLKKMCMNAVDRSQGQLVDILIHEFCDDELLLYIADRSSQLRRLHVACCYGSIWDGWVEALKKFPLLEELSVHMTDIYKEAIEAAGSHCPMLKTLTVNEESIMVHYGIDDEIAIAIAENLRGLHHLELIGNTMSNTGLQAILDNCHQLQSLDLRCCWNLNPHEDFGKRFSEQIKNLRLPPDSLDGCAYNYGEDEVMCPDANLVSGYLDGYLENSDTDDSLAYAYRYNNENDDDSSSSIDMRDLFELMLLDTLFD